MGDFRNAAPSRLTVATQAVAAKAFARSGRLALKVVNAGQVAEYVGWQEATFGRALIHRSREALWGTMSDQVRPGTAAVEFGVAWGYATDWWLTRRPDFASWDGFDRFTGLPRAWREHDAGTFDAAGKPPAITDPRVTWHVGDVEDMLPGFTVPQGPRLVLFDLDIYEPTVAAWHHIAPHLSPGDLLYFDEAMDADERRVLTELVLPSRSFDYLGGTSLALALRVS